MIRLAGGSLQSYTIAPFAHADPGDLGSSNYLITHNLNSINVLYDIGYSLTPGGPIDRGRVYYYTTTTAYRGIYVGTPNANQIQLTGYRIVTGSTIYISGKIWLPS